MNNTENSNIGTLSLIINLGIHYFKSAQMLRNHAIESEKSNDAEKYKLYCISSIVMSYLSLEAIINEFFIAARESPVSLGKKIDEQDIDLIASHWETVAGSQKTLIKYDLALLLARKPGFEKGSEPYQGVADLELLRNALVHFKPEIHTDQKLHKKVEQRLTGKFSLNPFLEGTGNPFFPSKCFSIGCADWAMNAVRNYVDEFSNRIGIVSIFQYRKENL